MTFEPKNIKRSKRQEQAIEFGNKNFQHIFVEKSVEKEAKYRQFLNAQADYVLDYANPPLPETVAVLLMSGDVSYVCFKAECSNDDKNIANTYDELYAIKEDIIDLSSEMRNHASSFVNLSKAGKQVYLAVMCASIDKILNGKEPNSGNLKDAVFEFEYVLERIKSEEEMFGNIAQSKIQELKTFIAKKENKASVDVKTIQKNKYRPS